MRKFFFVLLFILAITLTGCHSSAPPHTETDTPPESVLESDVQQNTVSDLSLPEIPSPNESDASSVLQEDLESETDVSPSKNTESNPPTPIGSTASTSQTEEKQPIKTHPDNSTQNKPEPNAVASDAKAIADKVVKYINQYRNEQGVSTAVRLPGLTEYAEYRSRQLVSNFAHDTDDERAAATALKYGEYIDPALYGMNGKPYYTACAGEAIAKAGYTGTVDEVAKSLAMLVKNSPEHWSYVGSSQYQYIAVGVTYDNGLWYCDIAMAIENSDEK